MKLQVVSDLHLEFPGASVDIQNQGDTDVLILGGDILTAYYLTRNPDTFIPFFEEVSSRFPSVIYLMGNHEHYHSRFDETLGTLKSHLPHIPNLNILEQDSVVLGDQIGFFGATLWTDCNGNDFETRRVLARGMNDYRLIQFKVEDTGKIGHLLPGNTLSEHCKTLETLSKFLDDNKDLKKVVVCTHHAPSKKSLHPRYTYDTEMNGGYSSDLDQFILDHPQIVLWTHGHTHDSFDYKIGSTRVVCNPAGYQSDVYRQRKEGKYENTNFNPGKVIEI